MIGASAAVAVRRRRRSRRRRTWSSGEGDGYVDLPVRLSAPGLNPVTVSYDDARAARASAGNSCGSDADYVSDERRRSTSRPGETTKVVRVQLLDCPDVEALISFRFNLSTPANATIARATHARQHRQRLDRRRDAAPVRARRGRRPEGRLRARAGAARRPRAVRPPTSTVTVHYATSDGTAIAGVDYARASAAR